MEDFDVEERSKYAGASTFMPAKPGERRVRKKPELLVVDATAASAESKSKRARYEWASRFSSGNALLLHPSYVLYKDRQTGKFEKPMVGDYVDFEELDLDNSVVLDRKDVVGRSLFATKFCKKGTVMAMYGGDVVNVEEEGDEDDYTVELHKDSKWAIRGTPHGDDAETLFGGVFANDALGLKYKNGDRAVVNAEITLYGKLVDGEPTLMPVVRCIRDVFEGQEILVRYGSDYWTGNEQSKALLRLIREAGQYFPLKMLNTDTNELINV